MRTATSPSSSRRLQRSCCAVLTAFCAAVCADETDDPAAANVAPLRYTEFNAQQTPRLDALEPSAAGTQLEAVRWTRQGAHSFGVALGASLDPATQTDLRPVVRPGVGLRWRSTLGSHQRLDVAAWRHFDGTASRIDGSEPAALTTRIEMQFGAPRKQTFGEIGALGMQLSSDAKLSLRVRKGGPMMYYRQKF